MNPINPQLDPTFVKQLDDMVLKEGKALLEEISDKLEMNPQIDILNIIAVNGFYILNASSRANATKGVISTMSALVQAVVELRKLRQEAATQQVVKE